jgi:hypothetical protein
LRTIEIGPDQKKYVIHKALLSPPRCRPDPTRITIYTKPYLSTTWNTSKELYGVLGERRSKVYVL